MQVVQYSWLGRRSFVLGPGAAVPRDHDGLGATEPDLRHEGRLPVVAPRLPARDLEAQRLAPARPIERSANLDGRRGRHHAVSSWSSAASWSSRGTTAVTSSGRGRGRSHTSVITAPAATAAAALAQARSE